MGWRLVVDGKSRLCLWVFWNLGDMGL